MSSRFLILLLVVSLATLLSVCFPAGGVHAAVDCDSSGKLVVDSSSSRELLYPNGLLEIKNVDNCDVTIHDITARIFFLMPIENGNITISNIVCDFNTKPMISLACIRFEESLTNMKGILIRNVQALVNPDRVPPLIQPGNQLPTAIDAVSFALIFHDTDIVGCRQYTIEGCSLSIDADTSLWAKHTVTRLVRLYGMTHVAEIRFRRNTIRSTLVVQTGSLYGISCFSQVNYTTLLQIEQNNMELVRFNGNDTLTTRLSTFLERMLHMQSISISHNTFRIQEANITRGNLNTVPLYAQSHVFGQPEGNVTHFSVSDEVFEVGHIENFPGNAAARVIQMNLLMITRRLREFELFSFTNSRMSVQSCTAPEIEIAMFKSSRLSCQHCDTTGYVNGNVTFSRFSVSGESCVRPRLQDPDIPGHHHVVSRSGAVS